MKSFVQNSILVFLFSCCTVLWANIDQSPLFKESLRKAQVQMTTTVEKVDGNAKKANQHMAVKSSIFCATCEYVNDTCWPYYTSDPSGFHSCCVWPPDPPPPPRPPEYIRYPDKSSSGVYFVEWENVIGAPRFHLERSVNDGPWEHCSYPDVPYYPEEVQNGSYRYRVRSCNTFAKSEWKEGVHQCVVELGEEPPITYGFDNDTDGWSFAGKVGTFDEPATSWEPSRIGLSPNGSTNCFSSWLSPDFLVKKDKKYRTQWTISSSVSNSDCAPDFRLRANQLSTYLYSITNIFSFGDAAPDTGTKTYELCFEPRIEGNQDAANISFDIINFISGNDPDAWIFLEQVDIHEFNVISASEIVRYDFVNVPQGWESTTQVGSFNECIAEYQDDRLGLCPSGNMDAFGYWKSPEIEVSKDKIYRAEFYVDSSLEDTSKCLDFRLRCMQASNWRCWSTGTLYSAKSIYPRSGWAARFDIIIFPQMETPTDTLQFFFDLIAFDTTKDLNFWIYLERLILDEVKFE